MRKWLALLATVAVLAVAGTALAMTGSDKVADDEVATETTLKVEATTTTIDEKAEPERTVEVDEVETVEEEEVVWEEPDEYVPYEPSDHNPPAIEILYPGDGQVFEKHEVVFEGTTEPGTRVFFGERQADVKDDGSWRIVLEFDEGEHLVTAKAIDEAGNDASDSVTVIVDIPEKPKKEEPKKEEPKAEEPKEEEPKKEEPKEEPAQEWEFVAHQAYGECSENPPYDVFYGKGHPGYTIVVESPFGRQTTEVGENGEWEIKVYFEGAPVGDVFEVWVGDQHDHHQVFEFVHTD